MYFTIATFSLHYLASEFYQCYQRHYFCEANADRMLGRLGAILQDANKKDSIPEAFISEVGSYNAKIIWDAMLTWNYDGLGTKLEFPLPYNNLLKCTYFPCVIYDLWPAISLVDNLYQEYRMKHFKAIVLEYELEAFNQGVPIERFKFNDFKKWTLRLALKAGASVDEALKFVENENDYQITALENGVPAKDALNFKNLDQLMAIRWLPPSIITSLDREDIWLKLAAIKGGISANDALKIKNYWQIEFIKNGMTLEQALEFKHYDEYVEKFEPLMPIDKALMFTGAQSIIFRASGSAEKALNFTYLKYDIKALNDELSRHKYAANLKNLKEYISKINLPLEEILEYECLDSDSMDQEFIHLLQDLYTLEKASQSEDYINLIDNASNITAAEYGLPFQEYLLVFPDHYEVGSVEEIHNRLLDQDFQQSYNIHSYSGDLTSI